MNPEDFQRLPPLKDLENGPEAIDLMIEKLKLCEIRFDFSNPRSDIIYKEAKRKTLVEIIDHVSTHKEIFADERVYQPIIDMVAANLFRALPVTAEDEFFDPEDDEPRLELAWPHIQIVYELLRRFIVSGETDPKLAKKYITQRFILGLLDLFDSEDPREREYLKTILHRLYGKIMPLRPFIRKSIMNTFHRFIHEVHRHNGVAELLEILGSIINGFALPLKDEHKDFLRKSLIPLHTPKSLPSYHVQLSFCVTQFVEKDPTLAVDVIRGLIRYWPITQSRKEVMFLNELEEVLELTRPEEFADVLKPFFKQISKCIESPHFQVAERALFFWNNEYIVNLIVQFKEDAVPLVYAALRRNAENHWNSNVQSLSLNVQKLLSEMDPILYELCAEEYEERMHDQELRQQNIEKKWEALEQLAQKKLSLRHPAAAGDDSLRNGETSSPPNSNEYFSMGGLDKGINTEESTAKGAKHTDSESSSGSSGLPMSVASTETSLPLRRMEGTSAVRIGNSSGAAYQNSYDSSSSKTHKGDSSSGKQAQGVKRRVS